MTEEEKQLLLVDLCSRLPYHTKIDAGVQGILTLNSNWYEINRINLKYDSDALLPYLRPMSSMADDEFSEMKKAYLNCPQDMTYAIYGGTDWLNAHHFDYRGLIEKGLALEAPEGMYNA